MKAIFPGTLGLVGLLLLGSAAHAYVWVSPVYKTPYPHAPDTFSSMYYQLDPWGRVIGTYYDVRPPFPPAATMLPGPIGHAIMSGNLPHTLLMSKEGMQLGDVPLLAHRNKNKGPQPPQPPGFGPQGPPPTGFGPQGPPPPNVYPTLGQPDMRRFGNVQQPYGVPTSPYPMQPTPPMMAPMPMPVPMPTMPYPHGAPMPYPPPMPYMPTRPPGPIAYGRPFADGNNGVYQAQVPVMNPTVPMAPMAPLQPRMPNPQFMDPRMMPQPFAPGMMPAPPMGTGVPPGFAPMQPMGPMVPLNPMAPVSPMNPLVPLQPMTPMTPMMPMMSPMQLPRMDMMRPPPSPQQGGSAYPTHPFTRSPRDFFMWSDNMEEERARGRGLPTQ